jgi:hypothetical protein
MSGRGGEKNQLLHFTEIVYGLLSRNGGRQKRGSALSEDRPKDPAVSTARPYDCLKRCL